MGMLCLIQSNVQEPFVKQKAKEPLPPRAIFPRFLSIWYVYKPWQSRRAEPNRAVSNNKELQVNSRVLTLAHSCLCDIQSHKRQRESERTLFKSCPPLPTMPGTFAGWASERLSRVWWGQHPRNLKIPSDPLVIDQDLPVPSNRQGLPGNRCDVWWIRLQLSRPIA